jgi:hypothetical protein
MVDAMYFSWADFRQREHPQKNKTRRITRRV